MIAGSLGFATDLAVLRRQGGVVERHDDWSVVRTPANPGFRWGNFVLGPASAEPERLAAAHAEAFPGARFATVGIDDPVPVVDEDRWRAAGFTISRNVVLAASDLEVDARSELEVRPFREGDWTAAVDLEMEEFDDREFFRRRYEARRAALEAGAAIWMAVGIEGRVSAVAGLIDAGGGVARYQDVLTSPSFRRRGAATALLGALARAARERFGTRRLVIVADPEGPAIDLYRRLGFRDVEQQLQLERLEPDVGTRA